MIIIIIINSVCVSFNRNYYVKKWCHVNWIEVVVNVSNRMQVYLVVIISIDRDDTDGSYFI